MVKPMVVHGCLHLSLPWLFQGTNQRSSRFSRTSVSCDSSQHVPAVFVGPAGLSTAPPLHGQGQLSYGDAAPSAAHNAAETSLIVCCWRRLLDGA